MARFFVILFRKRRTIELLNLDYDTDHLFDNSFIIINYRFRNAIYYRFGNHKTLEKQIKVFNIKNFDNEFDFVVYGFFRSKSYKIKFEPKLRLDTSNFKTVFSKLNLNLVEKTIPKLSHPDIYCEIKKPVAKPLKIKIKRAKIKISNTNFNQNEFI
jgi:hypothetical protein